MFGGGGFGGGGGVLGVGRGEFHAAEFGGVREFVEGADGEVVEEGVGGAVEEGAAWEVGAAFDFDEATVEELLDHGVDRDAADGFDAGAGDGLAVGDDGEGFEGRLAEALGLFAGVEGAAPVGVFGAGAEAPAGGAFDDGEGAVVAVVVGDEGVEGTADLDFVGLEKVGDPIGGGFGAFGGVLEVFGGFFDGIGHLHQGEGFLGGKEEGFDDGDQFHKDEGWQFRRGGEGVNLCFTGQESHLEIDGIEADGEVDLGFGVVALEGFLEDFAAAEFAVDEEDAFFGAFDGVVVGEEFVVVGVAGEGVEGFDFGIDLEFVAEDGDVFVAFAEFPAEGVFGAVADKQDHVFVVGDVVAEVVEDAAGLGHAGGGDDDGGAFEGVEGFGFVDAADEAEAVEAEWVVAHEDGVADVLAEVFEVETEDFGGADGEGAVDVGGDGFDAAFVDELVELVEELLGAFDGEGGDDDAGAAAADAVDDFADVVGGVGGVLVFAAAVGGLHDHVVDVFAAFGGVEEVVAGAADIAGEQEAEVIFAGEVIDVEDDLGRAEDVAGIDEGESDAFGDGEGAVVADGDELAEDVFGVSEGVAGGEELLVVAFAVFVEPLDVHFMDVGGVGEHDAAEVAGGGGGVDVAVEAVVAELGEVAAVVDVGVGEDDAVDLFGVEGEGAIAFHGLGAAALEEAAVEEDALAVDFEEVLRTGGGAGGTAEFDFHQGKG